MNGHGSDPDAIPLAIESRLKWLANNQRFADLTFIVGEDKEMVYAHKVIIASGQCDCATSSFACSNQFCCSLMNL